MTSVIFKYPDEGHEEAKKFLQLCTPHGDNKAELCLQKTKDERETWKYLKQESALEWGLLTPIRGLVHEKHMINTPLHSISDM